MEAVGSGLCFGGRFGLPAALFAALELLGHARALELVRVVLHRLVDADRHLAREEGVDVVVIEGHVNGAVGDALDLLHGFIEGADDRLVVVAVLDLLLRREADVLNDVLHADKEVAVLVERRLARAVVEVIGQTVGVFGQLAHPVGNELVVLREEEADTLGKGDVDLAGVFLMLASVARCVM